MSTMSEDAVEFVGLPADSPGSSVSTTLQEEYDELLKYAVIPQSYNDQSVPTTMSEVPGMPLFETLAKMVDSQHLRSQQSQINMEGDTAQSIVDQSSKNFPKDDLDNQTANNGATSGEFGNEVDDNSEIQSVSQARIVQQHSTSTPIEHTPTENRTQARVMKHVGEHMTEEHQVYPQYDYSYQYTRPLSSPVESVASTRLTMTDVSVAYTGGVDPDIARVENMIDQWTLDVKRNVLAEFGQSKIRLLEQHKQQMIKERERHHMEKAQLQNDLESMRELLHRYENSISRKDQVISNLTRGLQKHKDKNELQRAFCEWKVAHNDVKQECFASKLAEKHYHSKLMKTCYDRWHGLIENKWRNRVEKACQSKAQEICMGLTNEYESQISALNSALECARTEVEQLRQEREKYEETMKKAFMRGVCALNMEAMSMFNDRDNAQGTSDGPSDLRPTTPGAPVSDLRGGYMDVPITARVVPHDAIYHNEPPGAPLPRHVHVQCDATVPRSTATGHGVLSQGKSFTTGTTKQGKVISAKVTARVDTGRNRAPGAAAPTNSVIVERHQPPLVKYNPSGSGKSVTVQRKSTTSSNRQPTVQVHKVKVVE